MEIEIQDIAQFDQETAEGKVLVDFYATWCGPCKMLSPLVEKVAEENPSLKVLRVDVDRVGQAAARFNIYSIPTLLLFEGGKVKNKAVGYMPLPNLKRFAEVK